MRVLFVDDADVILELTEMWCQIFGIEYSLAHNAKEALTFCQRTNHARVVTDLNMPAIGGIALIQELHQRHPDLRVFAFAGDACNHKSCYPDGACALFFRKFDGHAPLFVEIMKHLAIQKYPFLA